MQAIPYPPTQHNPPSPASPGAWGVPPERAGELAGWLDELEREPVDPRLVDEELRRAGWHPVQAAAATFQYRRRFNEHALGYSALLIATGTAGLAAGTAGHLLTAGLDHRVARNALGLWLTLLVCSLPFAIWGHVWAARVDRDDPVAVWSQPRRSLARTLLWACGVVGIGRFVLYAGQLIGGMVGASWAAGNSAAAGAINVAITVSIALPLGLWAFRFLHRFDAEDPATPVPQRRRGRR